MYPLTQQRRFPPHTLEGLLCVCVGSHAQDGSEPCGTIACPPAQEWMGTSVYSYGHVTVQQCRGTEANTHRYVRVCVSVCVCVCVCVSPSIHPVCMEQAGAYANSTAGHADPGLDPAVTPWAPGPGSICCPDPGGGCRRHCVFLSGAFLYVKGQTVWFQTVFPSVHFDPHWK